MAIHIQSKLYKPQKRQMLVLIPFALFYCAAAILGQLEKARTLGALQNLGRIIAWFCGSYAVLLLLCVVISGRKGPSGTSRAVLFSLPYGAAADKAHVAVLL